MQVIFSLFLFMFGAGIGSFTCCQAQRFYLKTEKKSQLGKRSICLHCKRQLKWFENIPIFSWLLLKGRCRTCKQPIGSAEILAEIFTALAFLAISLTIDIASASPIEWTIFGFNILLASIFSFLSVYDGKWGELPNFGLILAIICSIIIALIAQPNFLNLSGAIAILFGTYFILNKISHGKWVGDGDAYIGLAIALALGSTWLAIWVLFIANLLGTLFVIIFIKNKHQKLYFGPFLAISFIIVLCFSKYINAII